MSGKYMIRCDIEGVSGVVSYEQSDPGKAEYAFGQRMFMADLLALVEGLKEGGADEVAIYDEHYYGRNIDLDRLPSYATAICGKPPYRADWAGGLEETFAGMALLGFHAKANTPGGLLPHSYELDHADLRLNGLSVGEIGMEAAIAGDCGVPTILVAGDSAGVAEARALLPDIAGVVVKEARSEAGALCYSGEVTARRIREAAARAVREGATARPLRIAGPVQLEVVLRDGAYLKAARQHCPEAMVDATTLKLEGANVTAVWAAYWQLKLRIQRLMAGKG